MEEPVAKSPPLKKRKVGAHSKTLYKCPRAREFFHTLQASHTPEQIHKMLAVGMEFSGLGW